MVVFHCYVSLPEGMFLLEFVVLVCFFFFGGIRLRGEDGRWARPTVTIFICFFLLQAQIKGAPPKKLFFPKNA